MKVDRFNILLIEDDPAEVRLIGHHLQGITDCHIDLIHVDSLHAAVRAVEEKDVDVILLDLNLPDEQGLQTLEKIILHTGERPIVVLTATDDNETAIAALHLGAQDYLYKNELTQSCLARAIRYAIERKHMEHERIKNLHAEHERNALRETVHSMEQVLAILGHELRTPLAALRATTEMLLNDSMENPEQTQRFLSVIHEEVIRMADLVHNLLEVARLNSGSVKWNWSEMRLCDVINEALQTVLPLNPLGRVSLRCDEIPRDLTMQGDPDAIRRLIINLVTNAQKHTHEGYIHVAASAVVENDKPWIRITVSDTGEGIPSHIIDKLGTAFALNSGVIGDDYIRGSGLGLAICKNIAAVHGGHLSVSTIRGQGTTFTACLRADLNEAVNVKRGGSIKFEQAA